MDIKTTSCEDAPLLLDHDLTPGVCQDYDQRRVESRIQKAVY